MRTLAAWGDPVRNVAACGSDYSNMHTHGVLAYQDAFSGSMKHGTEYPLLGPTHHLVSLGLYCLR